LTFKATSLTIARALKEEHLVRHEPLRPKDEEIGRLYVTPEISRTLKGGNTHLGFPHLEADRVIGMFVAGWSYRVTRRAGVQAELEQLVGLDEVWVLCFRKPRPGFRLMGRFLEQDTFVGLCLYDRHELSTPAKYAAAAARVISEWERIFGTIEPMRSDNLEAYMSGSFRDVDEDT
jgi:hypothetical protein